MATKIPCIQLNSGYNMPMLGLGTYNSFRPNEVHDAVKEAVKMGYRHIDTAFLYQTEGEIGEAIKELVKDKVVKREELFIVTKIWDDSHELHQVEPACRKSLDALGLDYIDLYLIHFPIAYADFDRKQPTMTDYLETWKGMEALVEKGLVKSIGVSNFNSKQLERILSMDGLKYKPANNQVEITPYLACEELVQFSHKHNITTTAYGPFGAPGQNYIPKDAPKFLEHPTLVEIGQRYGKSPAQVILRWNIQRGITVIPKSTNPARMAQNMDIFNFDLSAEEMKALLALDRGYRVNIAQWLPWKDHPHFPFEK